MTRFFKNFEEDREDKRLKKSQEKKSKKIAKEIDKERINSQKSSKKKIKEPRKAPKSSQDTLPYNKFTKYNITYLGNYIYSKTYAFTDINYHIAKQDDQDDIFIRYCNFLNLFDTSISIRISVISKSIKNEAYEEKILMQEREDNLNVYRETFNKILLDKLSEGRNDVAHQKYISIILEADNLESAKNKFMTIEIELNSAFKRIGSVVTELNSMQKADLIKEIFRDYDVLLPDFEVKDFERKKEKGYICPDYFEFKRDYFMFNDKYARCLFIRKIPKYLNDRILTDIADANPNQIVSVNILPVDPHKANNIVTKQITAMETNKMQYRQNNNNNGYVPLDLEHKLEEAKEFLSDLKTKNQKMFLMNLIIMYTASDYEELQKRTELLRNVARKHLCDISIMTLQQEQALSSVLPIGRNDIDLIRPVTTESVSIFIPFNTQELSQDKGFYYGLNAVSRNMILFNRKSLKVSNGFILGYSGSGKSFAAKREILNVVLNTDDDVIIIDPEREYSPLISNINGEIINISAASQNYINPLDLNVNYSDDENPIILKSEFVLSLCNVLIGGLYGLSPKAKTIIDRCLEKTYARFMQTFNDDDVPTLVNFYEQLVQQEEPEAKEIALELELYIKGSLRIFANKTNINLNNRIVCFDIKDLGTQLKTMGLLIVLDSIWNKITKNRSIGKNTWIYIDEMYLLFANEYSSNFFFELYKRARKWGAIPTGITQNVEDLLKSEHARRMLSNSEFIQMLSQAPTDRVELAKLLNISESQLGYITNADAGQGLLFVGNSIIPFVDNFPKNNKLYSLMTTKLDEVKDNEKDIEVGV